MKVWITGAGGLLGNQLVKSAAQFAPGWNVAGLTRAQLDLTDTAAVRRALRKEQPSCVLHCAALSRGAACEENPALARRVNVEATANLAELAAEIPFIFFFTDLVFDGHKGDYVETDTVNPLSVYAETKVAAERIVLAHPRQLVIRTSLTYGHSPTSDRSFNEEMLHAWRAGRTLKLFTDEFRCPIPAAVTARAVWELVAKAQEGICHVAGGERLSRWQIGQLIATSCPHLNPRLEPASLHTYTSAPRAPDTSLHCAKAQALLSFRLLGLTEWLAANPADPVDPSDRMAL
jgi:dTDP-4-dehydrorhamnose reductase